MRKVTFIIVFLALALHAQITLDENLDGIRVPAATTLPQGHLYLSGAFQVITDGEPLATEGSIDDKPQKNFSRDVAASSFNFQLSYGLGRFLEIGVDLPIHYEGHIKNTNLGGAAIGDVHTYLKGAFLSNAPVIPGISFTWFSITGKDSKGLRPRHLWYYGEEEISNAYSAPHWAMATTLYLTIKFGENLQWNNDAGYLHVTNGGADILLWGSGLEFFPQKKITLTTEISGETRIRRHHFLEKAINDQLRLTPGIRAHLPHQTDFMLSLDMGIDFVRNKDVQDEFELQTRAKEHAIRYSVKGSPKLAVNVGLSKTFNLSMRDTDNDGIVDRNDMCPNSAVGAIVNERGCPVDLDRDGILDVMDDCPTTPRGLAVDYSGCPIDEDHDGVPDYQDKCTGTPAGFAVDKFGCTLDHDGDGIDDNNDRCPMTPRRESVGADGCPTDDDHDGVLNEKDLCPVTPAGLAVDQDGCPMDFDGDGVPDDWDKCPNSRLGEKIDSQGCPADSDHDGVPDSRDLCDDTPDGFSVNQDGCPLDTDRDGVPDDWDKCINTVQGASVDTLGCPLDSDHDGVPDYRDRCPATFPNVIINKDGCPYSSKKNLNAIAKQVLFKPGSARLLNSSYTALNDVIYLMRLYKFDLEIQCSDKSENAQAISEQKAKAIYDYFIAKGIDETRLNAHGFGKNLPQGKEYSRWNYTGVRFIPSITKATP